MLLEASTTKTEEVEGEEDIGCGEPGKNKKVSDSKNIFGNGTGGGKIRFYQPLALRR